MKAFLVLVVSHDGERLQFAALARTSVDAQLTALDTLTAPPRSCTARPIGRSA